MIEPIGKILGTGGENYLNRIYLATKLQEVLKKLHPEPVKVVIKGNVVSLVCQSPAQATFYRLKRRKIYGEIINALGSANSFKVQIRVKS